MNDRTPTERVAVIAVHGVGHHRPLEAARSVADLLATSNPDDYTPFVELPVRIRVDRVPYPGARPVDFNEVPRAGFLDEKPAFVRRDGAPADEADAGIEFMRSQLECYDVHGSDVVYETACLTAVRGEGDRRIGVHVFDMYWSDISRVSTAGLRMIGELYQLLFYVASLGRKTLDISVMHNRSNAWLKRLAVVQSFAERLLVLFIPVLNLCALGLAVLVVPQLLYAWQATFLAGAQWQPVIRGAAIVLLACVMLGGTAWLGIWRPARRWAWLFPLELAACIVAGSLVPVLPLGYVHFLLAALCWSLVSAGILALMRVYDERRPGAYRVSKVVVALVAMALVALWLYSGPADPVVVQVGLWTATALYWALHGAWTLFIVAAVLVGVLGDRVAMAIAHGADGDSDESSAVIRSIWTGNLAIVIPGLLVLLLNLALWWGCYSVATKVAYLDPAVTKRALELLKVGTPWFFVVELALAAVALLTVVWALLPSIIGEVLPRRANDAGAPMLGRAIDESFLTMRWAGALARFVFIAVLPLTYVWRDLIPARWTDPIAKISQDSTLWIGLVIVAMVTAPGPLRALGLGLRTALDVAIDVANWLRLFPRRNNPRARICARFYSLVRHIVEYGEREKTDGFDRIVIVAHSQGTVISADLLRFLRSQKIPFSFALAQPEIVLFTMGCPLRQLYSQRFPDQYGWARYSHTDPPEAARPDPQALDVALWVNAYRSGDYIGRYLWHSDGDDHAWDTPSQYGRRREFCVGAGAHTHYWDETALPVGRQLDELLCRRGEPQPSPSGQRARQDSPS